MTIWLPQLKKRSKQSETHDRAQLDQPHNMDRRQPDRPAVRASVYPALSAPVTLSWTGERPGQTTVCKKGRCNEFAHLKRIGTPCQVPAPRTVT